MQLIKEYKNISETMYYLYLQIKDSIKFADRWLPGRIEDPSELYDLLKANTTFVNDGLNEVLQSMQTLMIANKNVWKIAGAGDCDCFVITATACCIVCNIPVKIVLAGRNKNIPVHIYNLVYDGTTWQPFDLTNKYYTEVRKYQYVQILPRIN